MPRTTTQHHKEERLSTCTHLEQETRIMVSPEELEWLFKIMDEPAPPAPRLHAALAQKPVWAEAAD